MDCLVDIIEEISTTPDRGEYAVSIFLDLTKAFNTVIVSYYCPNYLFYGVLNPDINCFKSLLNKRKQRVFVNGVISDNIRLLCF